MTASYKKIVTHAGQFHADEVLTIAFLRLLGCSAPIERTYAPIADDFADPLVVVLDVGQRYEPQLGNFDHHQDGNLEATNVLVLTHFAPKIGGRITDELSRRLFARVSAVDRGAVVFNDATPLPEFNTLIRAFNNVADGFDRAVLVATEILEAQFIMAGKAITDVDRWNALDKQGGIAVQQDTDVILGWKERAKAEGVFLLVCPNLRGGYSVISRDSNELIIPATEIQTFRHASGFMATYPTVDDAIAHARLLVPLPAHIPTRTSLYGFDY